MHSSPLPNHSQGFLTSALFNTVNALEEALVGFSIDLPYS